MQTKIDLSVIGEELRTQDNRITQDPLFAVQQVRKIYDDEGEYAGEYWEFVTACFTEKGAQAFIDCNGHNLKEPRIYAYSAYRNSEWIGLREFLMRPNLGKRVLTCIFCGEEYPQDTPTWGDGILVDHIKVCPKHPMREAEETNARLYAALVGLVGASDPEELKNMEVALRMMAMPSADKINTVNAIQALVEAAPARKETGTG